MPRILTLILLLFAAPILEAQERKRARDYGVVIGVLSPGPMNAITDVQGVSVGHTTLMEGDAIRTGVTVIKPHQGNIFQEKVPAAVYTGNGFGKLAGSTQVQELGNIETPIVLTNTLSVADAMGAVINYTLGLPENDGVRSVNAVVGETNDGWLNDIRGRHVKEAHVIAAIESANSGPAEEGSVGAGTGTISFGYKGGIGTASRKLPATSGGYTVGVLVQSNFGGSLQIDGVAVGEQWGQYYMSRQLKDDADGSCMIVIATDAPVDARNLERMAKRGIMGLAKTGGIGSNGSGDYVIAFSSHPELRIPYQSEEKTQSVEILSNDYMSPLFMGVIEATEEAIINSLFKATTMNGRDGHQVEALPLDKLLPLLIKKNKD